MSSTKEKIAHYFYLIFPIAVFLNAVMVMFAWVLRSEALIQIRPNMAPMLFNTAFCFASLALGLVLAESRYKNIAKILAVPVILLTSVTLLQYFFGTSLGVDSLFIKPFYGVGVAFPGRMAISTAMCLAVLGWLAYLRGSSYKYQIFVFAGASLVCGFGSISIAGYLVGFNSEYGWGSFSRMAMHTSISFVILSLFFIWQSHRELKMRKKHSHILVPYYVVAVGILSSLLIWQLLVLRDQERNRGIGQIHAESLRVNLDNAILPLQKALEHMARGFSMGSYQNQKMWTIDAESYYSEFKGIRRLLWSDERNIVRWVYPLTGDGDKMVGDQVRTKDAIQSQLKARGEEHSPFMSSLITLRTGGQGFVIMVPLFRDGVYRGDISASIVAKDFFEEVLKINDYDLVITEKGKTIFSLGTPDAVFAKDWTSRVQYKTLGLNWVIQLTPRPSLVRQNTSSLPGVVLLFGCSVSLLLGVTLIYFNKSQESERAAREAYEIKEAGMNSVPLLIISYDANAVIREMNSTAERLLGYNNKEVAGVASPLLFHDINEVRDVQAKMEKELKVKLPLGPEYISAFFNLGYNKASEWTVISKAGKRTTVVMSVSVIFNETGSIAGYLQILEDISLLKEKEHLLKEQERQILISSRMASLGEMAAGIAHEINNPLAIISGHVGVLRKKLQQKGVADDLELIKKVDAIESVVHRIAKIIRGLRSYSREPDEGGKEWISADLLVDETMAFCTEKFRMEGVQVKVTVEPGVNLYVRHYQISQVLLNLLNNAFDAVLGQAIKSIAIDVRPAGQGVELSVTDSGPGVPAALRSKIMQPFFTTKEVGKGMGLGLSISQGIIQSHDGKLYIDEGSTATRFVIWLPQGPKDSRPIPL